METELRKSILSLKEDQESQLQVLEAALREIENKRKTLWREKEALLKAIFATRAQRAPIRKLPLEVVICIFECALYANWEVTARDYEREIITCHPAHDIASLMLVCKSWRNIIVNSPTLWNVIYLIQPNFAKFGGWIEKEKAYIDLCLTRSRETLLNIVIDLNNRWPWKDYAQWQISKAFEHFGVYVADQVDQWYDNFVPWTICPAREAYEDIFDKLVSRLIGEEGAHMRRWRTVHITLYKDEEYGGKLWKMLDFPAPKLEDLVLDVDLHEIKDIAYHSFSYLGSLASLKLSRSFTIWGLVPPNYLRELEVTLHRSLEELNILSHLSTLEILVIHIAEGFPQDAHLPSLHFPNLQQLQLSGHIPDTFYQSFCLNYLPKLTLIDSNSEEGPLSNPYPPAKLFRVTEAVVYHAYGTLLQDINGIPPTFSESRLLSLLHQLASVRTIEVSKHLTAHFVGEITQLRSDGELAAFQYLTAKGSSEKIKISG